MLHIFYNTLFLFWRSVTSDLTDYQEAYMHKYFYYINIDIFLDIKKYLRDKILER